MKSQRIRERYKLRVRLHNADEILALCDLADGLERILEWASRRLPVDDQNELATRLEMLREP